jgi:citrate lyase beta subunit
LNFHRSERLVRLNAVGSGLEEQDLLTVLPAHPDGVVIPKVENQSQIKAISAGITRFETQNGLPPGQIPIIVVVESARGLLNLIEISCASSRLEAIIFGAEDFAGDLGAIRTQEGWEVFYARSAVVTHAAAYGLQAIDMVYTNFQDPEGLQNEAMAGARLGFSGKQVIHPNQVAAVQAAFTPSDASIAYAQRIMAYYAEHQDAGKGVFALDGKMIDAPIIKSAERVLSLARAVGRI